MGPDALTVDRPTGVKLLDFFCSGIQFHVLLSPYLYFISYLYLDLYVLKCCRINKKREKSTLSVSFHVIFS